MNKKQIIRTLAAHAADAVTILRISRFTKPFAVAGFSICSTIATLYPFWIKR